MVDAGSKASAVPPRGTRRPSGGGGSGVDVCGAGALLKCRTNLDFRDPAASSSRASRSTDLGTTSSGLPTISTDRPTTFSRFRRGRRAAQRPLRAVRRPRGASRESFGSSEDLAGRLEDLVGSSGDLDGPSGDLIGPPERLPDRPTSSLDRPRTSSEGPMSSLDRPKTSFPAGKSAARVPAPRPRSCTQGCNAHGRYCYRMFIDKGCCSMIPAAVEYRIEERARGLSTARSRTTSMPPVSGFRA